MRRTCLRLFFSAVFCSFRGLCLRRHYGTENGSHQPQDYALKRISSADLTGANADFREIQPAGALTLLDANGPACSRTSGSLLRVARLTISKRLMLRIYWDNENGAERGKHHWEFLRPRTWRIP